MDVKTLALVVLVSIAISHVSAAPTRTRRSFAGFSPFRLCPALDCYMTDVTLSCDYPDRYISTINGLGGTECPGCPSCRNKAYLDSLIQRHANNVQRLKERNDNFDSAVAVLQESLEKLKHLNDHKAELSQSLGPAFDASEITVETVAMAMGQVLKEQRAGQMETFLQNLKRNVEDVVALIHGDYNAVQRQNAADIQPNGEYFTFIHQLYQEHVSSRLPDFFQPPRAGREEAQDVPTMEDTINQIELLLDTVNDVRATTQVGSDVVEDLLQNSDLYYKELQPRSLMLRSLFYSLEENDNILLQAFNFWGDRSQVEGLKTIAGYINQLLELIQQHASDLMSQGQMTSAHAQETSPGDSITTSGETIAGDSPTTQNTGLNISLSTTGADADDALPLTTEGSDAMGVVTTENNQDSPSFTTMADEITGHDGSQSLTTLGDYDADDDDDNDDDDDDDDVDDDDEDDDDDDDDDDSNSNEVTTDVNNVQLTSTTDGAQEQSETVTVSTSSSSKPEVSTEHPNPETTEDTKKRRRPKLFNRKPRPLFPNS